MIIAGKTTRQNNDTGHAVILNDDEFAMVVAANSIKSVANRAKATKAITEFVLAFAEGIECASKTGSAG